MLQESQAAESDLPLLLVELWKSGGDGVEWLTAVCEWVPELWILDFQLCFEVSIFIGFDSLLET